MITTETTTTEKISPAILDAKAVEKLGTEKIGNEMVARKMSRNQRLSRDGRRAQSGFSLLEVVISMAVLTVGMVSLLGVFGLAMATTQTSQLDLIAKQLADESYESIVTARNTTQINWDDIQNVGSTNCTVTGANSCGIFLSGMQSIYNAGADGIYGTADDSAAGAQTLQDPGPDGVFLTRRRHFRPLDRLPALHRDYRVDGRERQHFHLRAQRDHHRAVCGSPDQNAENLHSEFLCFAVQLRGDHGRSSNNT